MSLRVGGSNEASCISDKTSFNIFSPSLRYFENEDGSNPNAAHASDCSVVVARYRNTNARASSGVSCLRFFELLCRGTPEVMPIRFHFTLKGTEQLIEV